MTKREDVRFPVDGGIELAAWFYTPEGKGPFPAITMAHGFAGTREHGLDRAARAFVEAGFAVLVHDHRNFGGSGGEPRQEVNPWHQLADWRRAISYLETRPEIDPKRIGLWGTSFSGGHAIVLGAMERRLKAVVSQVPTINGYVNGQRRVLPENMPAMNERFARDSRAQLRGEPPAMQMIVSHDPKEPAIYHSGDTVDFYLQPLPKGLWENKVTLQSTFNARMYEPGGWVDRVSPTPLLMIVADHDTVAASDLQLAAYERALEPKKLVLIHGDHSAPYGVEFDRAMRAAVEWFEKCLVAD